MTIRVTQAQLEALVGTEDIRVTQVNMLAVVSNSGLRVGQTQLEALVGAVPPAFIDVHAIDSDALVGPSGFAVPAVDAEALVGDDRLRVTSLGGEAVVSEAPLAYVDVCAMHLDVVTSEDHTRVGYLFLEALVGPEVEEPPTEPEPEETEEPRVGLAARAQTFHVKRVPNPVYRRRP